MPGSAAGCRTILEGTDSIWGGVGVRILECATGYVSFWVRPQTLNPPSKAQEGGGPWQVRPPLRALAILSGGMVKPSEHATVKETFITQHAINLGVSGHCTSMLQCVISLQSWV